VLTFFRDPDALVTFLIGPDEKKFIVHKEFACHYSAVLKAAFDSEFIEGQTQTYRLDDTTEEAFRLYVQWLYFQQLKLIQLQDCNIEDKNSMAFKEAGYEEDRGLFGLWILADKLGMPRLQNLAIESVEKIFQKTIQLPTPHLRYIYDNTSASSLLRRYMVKRCQDLSQTSWTDNPNVFPHAFLIDFAAYTASYDAEDDFEMKDYLVDGGDA
jgi:hypothetical protein